MNSTNGKMDTTTIAQIFRIGNLNQPLLRLVYEVVQSRTVGAARKSAFARAYDFLRTPTVDYLVVEPDGTLLVPGSRGREIYRANSTCQCAAYQFNRPCWHRALAYLVKRYRKAKREGMIQADAQGYFRVIAPDGTDLGYEESFTDACDALDAWVTQVAS